ncbi:MAG: hypothetical protein HY903_18205 [Deltaproteobacteria bacterium]|nr:hypothetical protein [Deltaproteobacteria bacterium]
MQRGTHPGTIVYVDGTTGAVVDELPISQVPEAGRFVAVGDTLVPVVRVVAMRTGARRCIYEYGPQDELLRATEQHAANRSTGPGR